MTDNSDRRYPGNSHAQREKREVVPAPDERKPLKKVIKGEASRRVPIGRRIANSFRGEDGRSIGEYVLFEIIIPSVKDTIVDAGKDALERAFFGDTGGSRSRSRSRGGSSYEYRNNKTQYSKRYPGRNFEGDGGRNDDRRSISRRSRSTHNFDEVTLETRGDAEEVLDALRNAIDQFHEVTVADLYDLVDISWEPIDRTWGWTDLRDAQVRRLRSDLYVVDLPDTERLD